MTSRALVAGGQIQALVAAGTHTLDTKRVESAFSEKFDSFISSIDEKMFMLENKDKLENTIAKFASLQKPPVADDEDLDKKIQALAKKFES